MLTDSRNLIFCQGSENYGKTTAIRATIDLKSALCDDLLRRKVYDIAHVPGPDNPANLGTKVCGPAQIDDEAKLCGMVIDEGRDDKETTEIYERSRRKLREKQQDLKEEKRQSPNVKTTRNNVEKTQSKAKARPPVEGPAKGEAGTDKANKEKRNEPKDRKSWTIRDALLARRKADAQRATAKTNLVPTARGKPKEKEKPPETRTPGGQGVRA